jgi:hypothetical protein
MVDGLWNGEAEHPVTKQWVDTPHWMELRAYAERTGDLESENLVTSIDLERALAALQSKHPTAAAIIACVALLDFSVHDLQGAFGGRTNWVRQHNKAVAWMAAWLNGLPIDDGDPDKPSCERAFRKAH